MKPLQIPTGPVWPNALLRAGVLPGLLGWAAPLWWGLELFTHFRLQYAAGLGLLALLLIVTRHRRPAAWALGFALANAAEPAWFALAGRAPAAAAPATLRLLLANVETENRQFAAVIALVRARQPDVVAIIEADGEWVRALGAGLPEWPHRLSAPRADNFGLALLSRVPLEESRAIDPGGNGLPALHAVLALPDGPAPLFVVHPPPPLGATLAQMRDESLEAIARAAAEAGPRAILAGDFNATPWSPAFRRFRAQSGLRPAGPGWPPTWPTDLPPLGIPIDHVWLGPAWGVAAHEVERAVGSDHWPVWVEVGPAGGAE